MLKQRRTKLVLYVPFVKEDKNVFLLFNKTSRRRDGCQHGFEASLGCMNRFLEKKNVCWTYHVGIYI